jgi:hypothetical protein
MGDAGRRIFPIIIVKIDLSQSAFPRAGHTVVSEHESDALEM